jgi:hypothetical protein
MDFDAYYAELETELIKLAGKQFKKYRNAAQKDVSAYLRESRGRLQDYTRLLEAGKLTPSEKDFLVAGLKENAVLYALKESGRTGMALRRFLESMICLSLELAVSYALNNLKNLKL